MKWEGREKQKKKEEGLREPGCKEDRPQQPIAKRGGNLSLSPVSATKRKISENKANKIKEWDLPD